MVDLSEKSWNTPPSEPVPTRHAVLSPTKTAGFTLLSVDLISLRKPHGPPCGIVHHRGGASLAVVCILCL